MYIYIYICIYVYTYIYIYRHTFICIPSPEFRPSTYARTHATQYPHTRPPPHTTISTHSMVTCSSRIRISHVKQLVRAHMHAPCVHKWRHQYFNTLCIHMHGGTTHHLLPSHIQQHAATHCNALQHTATHCRILICCYNPTQHGDMCVATHMTHAHVAMLSGSIALYTSPTHYKRPAIRCNTLQHTATHCKTRTATCSWRGTSRSSRMYP